MLNEKINKLKKKVIQEANIAENIVRKSIKGLVEKRKDILLEIINIDEPEINEIEIELDELCVNLIALYELRAVNVRTVIMILRMNKDLERIGDLGKNIAQSALYLIEKPQVKPLIDIPRMADETAAMLKDAITSFIYKDTKLAKSVCKRDEVVDNLRDQILRELITYMTADPSTIERSINLIRISRNLERIADLSTNISEDVIFMTEGKIIKHQKNI